MKHLELEMCQQRKLSELSSNVLSAGIQKCVFISREKIPDTLSLGKREVESVNWTHLANILDEMFTSNTGL